MAIQYLRNLDRAGAAVYLYLLPPDAAELRLIRRFDDTFPLAPTGAGNIEIYAGLPVCGVIDWHEVLPGVEHFYAPYYRVGDTWTLGAIHSITPSLQTHQPTLDSLDVIRERVEVGLNSLVSQGFLHHPRGQFTVLTAPPVIDDSCFPAVAVRLEQATSDQHFIGGFIGSAIVDDLLNETEGWWSRYQVQVESWSLNPDERRLIRRCLRDTLIAGRDVLELTGIMELDASFSDSEDFQQYSTPMYLTRASLNYLAPDVIWHSSLPLRVIEYPNEITVEDAIEAAS